MSKVSLHENSLYRDSLFSKDWVRLSSKGAGGGFLGR